MAIRRINIISSTTTDIRRYCQDNDYRCDWDPLGRQRRITLPMMRATTYLQVASAPPGLLETPRLFNYFVDFVQQTRDGMREMLHDDYPDENVSGLTKDGLCIALANGMVEMFCSETKTNHVSVEGAASSARNCQQLSDGQVFEYNGKKFTLSALPPTDKPVKKSSPAASEDLTKESTRDTRRSPSGKHNNLPQLNIEALEALLGGVLSRKGTLGGGSENKVSTEKSKDSTKDSTKETKRSPRNKSNNQTQLNIEALGALLGDLLSRNDASEGESEGEASTKDSANTTERNGNGEDFEDLIDVLAGNE